MHQNVTPYNPPQIFNDEVDAYESWDLFLILCSILVLVSGVVLLTNKKPDQRPHMPNKTGGTSLATIRRTRRHRKGAKTGIVDDAEEVEGLRGDDADLEEGDATGDAMLWELGEASEDDGDELSEGYPSPLREGMSVSVPGGEGERARMMEDSVGEEEDGHRASVSSDATLAQPPGEAVPYTDDFADWARVRGRVHDMCTYQGVVITVLIYLFDSVRHLLIFLVYGNWMFVCVYGL